MPPHVAQYVLPVGLHFDHPPPALEEGYEIHWRDDDDPPHYFFYVQVSALRAERLFRAALDCLPQTVHAVLEVLKPEDEIDLDPDGPIHDRWVSDLVHRNEVLRIVRRYGYQIFHDGMVGFGVYDADSPLEVLVDEHKLLNIFAPHLDPYERLLEHFGVPCVAAVETMIELPHEHHTLAAVPGKCRTPVDRYLSRRRFDVDWFSEAIRRRLDMRPASLPIDQDRG